MGDAIFEHPRLVAIYDAFDTDRSDLDVYAGIVDELGARRVLDLGCGTGAFALLLADRGLTVTGVDPAAEMLAVARAKPGAHRVSWIHGDATALAPMTADPWVFAADGARLTSDSTLRFRQRDEVEAALRTHGFAVDEVRGAPDRLRRELVFLAHRTA